MIQFRQLPVYEQKDRILSALEVNQVIVVESPTGSGKTTQLPIILHEAGYTQGGIVGVTQPRRIAAVSVSEFIAKQFGCAVSELVGYKMRFEDKTSPETQIKIMTDGILLQEMKLDPWLSKYSVIMVDEAHERSLNIDFILGLLKRILQERKDFKVIISSATINTDMFSLYFDSCPVIKIDAITYPVTTIFDPPAIPASTETQNAEAAMLDKIASIVERILDDGRSGAILVFLPGERAIKNCIDRLTRESKFRKLYPLPLYGRLSKEEQESVFDPPPFGKKKIVVATNIAETSITINDITTVIDSGLAKLNFYNPLSYTSSLDETQVSKSSCNQRRGRAGRTQKGTCYRLYSRKGFENRQLYTLEEIYRTDLSEVVMRMAELGIFDFENFDFISPPGKRGIIGAVETLNMLGALEKDRSLSSIGEMMCKFPLAPRQSRMIVEAIIHYPESVDDVIVATAFLSARSPFIFPDGKELHARRAHASFDEPMGDFASFLKIYRLYVQAKDKKRFCEISYLDERVMAEIANIKEQLELIVSDMGVPILSGGKIEDYLASIAQGMIQFVCVQHGKDSYRSLTAEKISIHPGSCMYKNRPRFIVAGEIVRTSRMYAMSVSPLSKKLVAQVAPALLEKRATKETRGTQKSAKDAKNKEEFAKRDDEERAVIAGSSYAIKKIKGKKHLVLPWELFSETVKKLNADVDSVDDGSLQQLKGLRCIIEMNNYQLFTGEKLELVLKAVSLFDIRQTDDSRVRNKNFTLPEDLPEIISALDLLFKTTVAKQKSKQLGFITLFSDGKGIFWLKTSRGFHTSLHENLVSVQNLIDLAGEAMNEQQQAVTQRLYKAMKSFFA
ncbi:ATP-dependent RNA helicase [Treponema phagedenis]|uniref:RNA helicase n=1 Tax=Treponema phagedenis TaxID=162 RepID=A0A0B7GV26_TREPH|nr:ATP-dependent RNA helicase [Treponema phagedenis]QEJ94069.1 ATP-dependent RNA helicase [Treponema phagedenis]QEK01921.1 ATP-dependent RNA helicase [Treponema phagedenis]QEK02679.1 ATP-dependent RNA helicase [Treponema phagedenis]QEK07033.1 ATP-dependent RNA helicase [Treponema phagedenis]QEK08306.1 ATP-dependent RNA helicase [Treponema phagedenis]